MGFYSSKIANIYVRLLRSGHERTVKAKKNIFQSIVIKGISILIGFIYVPLLAKYLGNEEYGIWLTLSGFISWVGFFDIGLGNGLRNKFAEAIANNDTILAKKYVSTSYMIITFIVVLLIIIINIFAGFLNWQDIFNSRAIPAGTLLKIVSICLSLFSIRLVVQLISPIILADQRPALSSLFNVLSNLFSLLSIIILVHVNGSLSLLTASIFLSLSPIIVLSLANLFLFMKKYNFYKPSIKFFDTKYIKEIVGLGLKFFIYQVYGIVFISATNLIISQLINPSEVPKYYSANKLFSASYMIFGIILTPFWSATTEAFVKNDYSWIKRTMRQLQRLGYVFIGLIIIMMMISKWIYAVWLNNLIEIPLLLTILVGIQAIIMVVFSPYISFLNGVGKMNLNLYLIPLNITLYIVFCWLFLIRYHFGVPGIVLAALISEIPIRVSQVLQYNLIMSNRAKGVWNK